MVRLTRLVLWALGALMIAVTSAWLAPLGWPFELFAHFRPQYAVAAALIAASLLLLRRPAPAGLALLLAVVLFWPAAARPRTAPTGSRCGEELDVVTANVSVINRSPSALLRWLGSDPPDLLLLQEVSPAWTKELEGLSAYPYRHIVARNDTHGIAALSRWPAEFQVIDLVGDGLPMIVGEVETSNGGVRVVSLHAHWPVSPELMRRRDLSLQRLAVEVRQENKPWIVGGDFNLTRYSPVFDRLIEGSGLRDTQPAHRWEPTWLAAFWPLALRIDHVFVSPEFCVDSSVVGPGIGSDHRPVRVRLRWPHDG